MNLYFALDCGIIYFYHIIFKKKQCTNTVHAYCNMVYASVSVNLSPATTTKMTLCMCKCLLWLVHVECYKKNLFLYICKMIFVYKEYCQSLYEIKLLKCMNILVMNYWSVFALIEYGNCNCVMTNTWIWTWLWEGSKNVMCNWNRCHVIGLYYIMVLNKSFSFLISFMLYL